MSGKSEKEKQKVLQENHQAILNELLKEKSNTFCVDCNCKGPRWASWNLGVFLCIRCAGIHRNLGVHISRVKSVNLDSWTPEQISMMQQMGNSVAKSVYEANLPPNFPVPQTDSALEALIRAKYEYKKYIAKDWSPPIPKVQSSVTEPIKKEKKHRNRSLPSRKPEANSARSRDGSPGCESKTSVKSEEPVELLNFDAPETVPQSRVVVQDFLGLEDGRPSDPVRGGDDGDLVSEFESLDLLGVESGAPDQARLANDAILALYGPSNDSILSGSIYVHQQRPALYGSAYSSRLGLGSLSSGGGNPSLLMSSTLETRKPEATPATSSLSGAATWAQPSSLGRSTLCTSLWQ